MTDYKVTSTDSKNFILTTDDKKIGSLKYETWYSFRAEVNLADNTSFDIEPKGLFGTTIELKKDHRVLLNFKMNWNGQIIVKTKFDGIEEEFIFKHRGMLKIHFVLVDQDERQLLVVKPDFKWRKLNFDYDIETTSTFDKLNSSDILLLAIVHCSNYYMTMMNS